MLLNFEINLEMTMNLTEKLENLKISELLCLKGPTGKYLVSRVIPMSSLFYRWMVLLFEGRRLEKECRKQLNDSN